MNQLIKTTCMAALVFFTMVAHAEVTKDKVMASLKKHYPSTTFSSVEETPFNGIYQVVMGRNIAYTDVDGRYFLFGHLYDMAEQKDVTQERKNELMAISFDDLPFEGSFKVVRGNGKKELAIFTTPGCPYCVKLEKQLIGVNDVTVHVFLTPMNSFKNAKQFSENVWCAKDPGKAWIDLMVHGKEPAKPKKCRNDKFPFTANTTFAGGLGMRGTPFLVAADGTQHKGLPDALKLGRLLAKKRPTKQSVKAAAKSQPKSKQGK